MSDEPSSSSKKIIIIVIIVVIVLIIILAITGVVLYFVLRKKTPEPTPEPTVKAVEVDPPTIPAPGKFVQCEDYNYSYIYPANYTTAKDSTRWYQPIVGYQTPTVPKYYLSGPRDRINIVVVNNTSANFELRTMAVGFDNEGNVNNPIVSRAKMSFPPGTHDLKTLISEKGVPPDTGYDDTYYAVFNDQQLKWGIKGQGYKSWNDKDLKMAVAPINPSTTYMKIVIDDDTDYNEAHPDSKSVVVTDYYCEGIGATQ